MKNYLNGETIIEILGLIKYKDYSNFTIAQIIAYNLFIRSYISIYSLHNFNHC